jgi:A/G-specific adenine glycosylase
VKHEAFRRAIIRWYRRSGRDLPWRRTTDAYAILVSEVMLQQTQVDRVIPKYRAFLRRFPTLRALARARLADVLRVWSGLGYNGRARRLWECARVVVSAHGGRLPDDVSALVQLPGIGRYTAGAVASFAYGIRTPAVDTNIRRVLLRAIDGVDSGEERRVWEIAERVLPKGGAGEWSQALMDVGALFCRPVPKCDACPARDACRARSKDVSGRVKARPLQPRTQRQSKFAGSRRFYRGRIVRALALSQPLSLLRLGEQVKEGFGESDLPWLEDVLAGLARDGLVVVNPKRKKARLP